MERPSEVADAAGLALLDEEVEDAVVHEAFLEVADAVVDTTEGVEEVVVDVVDAEFLETVVIHLDAGLVAPVAEVGHLGGDEPFVARMAAEGDACSLFGHAFEIHGGGIEVVDAVGDGIVDHLVDGLLVEFGVGVLAEVAAALDGQTHHAETQERHLLAVGVGTVGHLVGRHLAGGVALGGNAVGVVASGSHRGSRHDGSGEAFEELSSVHYIYGFNGLNGVNGVNGR